MAAFSPVFWLFLSRVSALMTARVGLEVLLRRHPYPQKSTPHNRWAVGGAFVCLAGELGRVAGERNLAQLQPGEDNYGNRFKWFGVPYALRP